MTFKKMTYFSQRNQIRSLKTNMGKNHQKIFPDFFLELNFSDLDFSRMYLSNLSPVHFSDVHFSDVTVHVSDVHVSYVYFLGCVFFSDVQ